MLNFKYQNQLNLRLNSTMMMMMIVFSKAMLCHYAFPDCVIRAGDAAGLPLCYEECVAIQQQFCYTEWADLLKQRERGAVFRSRGHFRLPECKLLPKIEQGMGGHHHQS